MDCPDKMTHTGQFEKYKNTHAGHFENYKSAVCGHFKNYKTTVYGLFVYLTAKPRETRHYIIAMRY